MIRCCVDNRRSDGGRRPQHRTLSVGRPGWRSCWAGSRAGFGRVEPRRRARAFVLGLLADLPRKNCWTIAEHAGEATPDGMQHLLARAVWDHDGVRDDVRDYLVEHLGDPDGVLVVDETGDLKKGTAHGRGAAPVHRHRRPGRERPGRGLPGVRQPGRARGDRPGAVRAPGAGPADPDRCQAAGVPDQVRVCDQAGPGHGHARPRAGRGRASQLGDRR